MSIGGGNPFLDGPVNCLCLFGENFSLQCRQATSPSSSAPTEGWAVGKKAARKNERAEIKSRTEGRGRGEFTIMSGERINRMLHNWTERGGGEFMRNRYKRASLSSPI